MNADMEKIKALMKGEGYTCVLTDGQTVICSRERGVKPLLELYESGRDMSRFCAADKVVGKAAAHMYALMGVREVYAEVLSRHALELFKDKGISAKYGSLVDAIRNRSGDGYCPMEQATLGISDPRDAYEAIKTRLSELREAR